MRLNSRGPRRPARLLVGLAFSSVLTAGGLAARADTVDGDASNTIYARYDAAASSNGLFVYDLVISGGTEIRDLDAAGPATTYMTLFDFHGLIGTPTFEISPALAAAGFSAHVGTPATGLTPPGILPAADSAGVPNITVSFNNSDPAALYTSATLNWIGTLTARSSSAGAVALEDNVASYDYRTRNGVTRVSQSLTDTTVPVAVVPLPGVLWGAAGLMSALFGLRLRRSLGAEIDVL